MKDIVLYCKSYSRDVQRAKRLSESVRHFNTDNLVYYVSCPSIDLPLFRSVIGTENVIILPDEEIITSNRSIIQADLDALPGGLSQQIVKSEFWRLGICENYLCLDSDSYFIRNFSKSDLLSPDGTPYTVMNESLELRLFGAIHQHTQIEQNREAECKQIMNILERSGRFYDFGPLPVVWSMQVWKDLENQYLNPRKMNFLDAIRLFPSEMRWYGEALLKYKSIDLLPVETLFRCYHYEDQFRDAAKSGETDSSLSQVYLGVCRQSNWDKELDNAPSQKNLLSQMNRIVKKRILKRLV